MSKGRDKIERLLQSIDELQAEDTKNQLAARRAERDLREEKEKALRLERELEGWKGLRMERGSGRAVSGWGSNGSVRGAGDQRIGSEAGSVELRRMMSDSKGFL